ncbi:energy transducer TonB [Hymenobacter sp. UYP22]|uniref:energy transducer TonB n=1 Tax=Hymenobacter sp. UYP22 TaxID=3156348 RepID=UPI0033958365
MYRFLIFIMLFIGLRPLTVQSQASRGQMKNGKPAGVWEYYDGKELALKFDYDSSRIQYIRSDTAKYQVLVDTTWQVHRLDRAPRLLGGKDELLGQLSRKLRYPFNDIRERNSGTVIITYVIDELGRKTTPVATMTPSVSLAEEVYKVLESADINYLPAIYQGKPTPAKVAFIVRFALCTSMNTNCITDAKRIPMPIGSLGELVVQAYVQRTK